MPDKTLKEKVDAAWELLEAFPGEADEITEALTALEERVKELEKENQKLKNPVPGYITGQW